jgi:F0F1-type ATP synthase membrane subunit c/vacuolar-type H+-ATPase subunit K
MTRKLVPMAVSAALLVGASQALAEGETVVAYGTGQVPVAPADPKSEASIRAAIAAAQPQTTPAAIADAKAKAQDIANASALTLGAIFSVEEQGNPYVFGGIPGVGGFGGFGGGIPFGGGGVISGPFNGNFCGNTTRAITKRVTVKGKVRVKVVRRVRERRCFVPTSVVSTLQVTFRATPKV